MKRGIELNNSEFYTIANTLSDDCDGGLFKIRMQLKHYEGGDQHKWVA